MYWAKSDRGSFFEHIKLFNLARMMKKSRGLARLSSGPGRWDGNFELGR
jgi:hypothetical protein